MNRTLICLFVLVVTGCATSQPKPANMTAEQALGLDHGPGPRPEDATSLPPDDRLARQCDQQGDPGCLKLATRCHVPVDDRRAHAADSACRPLVDRCGQDWIGAIEPACRLAYGDVLDSINEEIDRDPRIQELEIVPSTPVPPGQ